MAIANWKACLVFVATAEVATSLVGVSEAGAAASFQGSSGAAKLIGYFDANSQLDLPVHSLPQINFTHIILTNVLKVDNKGVLHFRPKAHESELDAVGLMKHLAAGPAKLVVSIRGNEDDVALDELSEVDSLREDFATNIAIFLRNVDADGLEIEWHSDDPAGGKALAAPFDAMERYHFALLCRDLAGALRAAGGRTLSVAVRPGRQEFTDGAFVEHYIDWLTLRAYSMRSLGDPHHSSLKDMTEALGEWTARGVPRRQLVLGIPLFGRCGAALSSPDNRNEGSRSSWKELSGAHLRVPPGGNQRGDVFIDDSTGKTWWVSGLDTTRAKVKHILENGYGGIAFRDLHQDAQAAGLSLASAASKAVQGHGRKRSMHLLGHPLSLFQNGLRRSRSDDTGKPDEL